MDESNQKMSLEETGTVQGKETKRLRGGGKGMGVCSFDLQALESKMKEDMRWCSENVSDMCATTGLAEWTLSLICSIITNTLRKHGLLLHVSSKSLRDSRTWCVLLLSSGRCEGRHGRVSHENEMGSCEQGHSGQSTE